MTLSYLGELATNLRALKRAAFFGECWSRSGHRPPLFAKIFGLFGPFGPAERENRVEGCLP